MGPKKKSSKKDRARMTAELMEKMRIEQEQEAARMLELEKRRLEEERLAALKEYEKEIAEQEVREEHLQKSVEEMEEINNFSKTIAKKERDKSEWDLYVDCGKLPNPSKCDQMNTYLHLWKQVMEKTTVEEASKRTVDVIELLNEIENLLDTATTDNKHKIENWKWIRQKFREYQRHSPDVATYRLLRNIAKNLNRIDIFNADFDFRDDYIHLSLWLKVQQPIPLPNPRRPPKPRVEVMFSNLDMQVSFPLSIDCESATIRAMYLKYDHLSDQCQTFLMPVVPLQLLDDLQKAAKKEWRLKLKYRYDHRDKDPKSTRPSEDIENSEREEENDLMLASDEEISSVPYKKLEPPPAEFAITKEDLFYRRMRENFTLKIPDTIVNLRKHSVLGGVFHLDLLRQPPQPQNFITMNMSITGLYLPKQLEQVPFYATYIPPEPPEPGVRRQPEEIEEEMKMIEQEMDKLMLITVTWPPNVIFLELPFVCQWDEREKHWTKAHVHDLKHNEEKSTLTFRTGIFGTFGLATIRYANLPYQAWEVRPEPDGSVMVQITAAILILEFNVKGGLVCLSQLQNSPNSTLENALGAYTKLHKLKRTMKEAGIDVFPEHDAFCYIDNSCEKHWPMEKHLYCDMARLCSCFNFAWSRWNLTAGRRKIVLQMREFFPNKTKQSSHSMLLITPLQATFIECTEVSQLFPMSAMKI